MPPVVLDEIKNIRKIAQKSLFFLCICFTVLNTSEKVNNRLYYTSLRNAYSTFITSDKRLNAQFSALKDEYRGTDVEKRGFVFVDYSAIDSGLTEEGAPRSPGFITGVSYMDEWEQLDGETYTEKKNC